MKYSQILFVVAGFLLVHSCKTKMDCPAYSKNNKLHRLLLYHDGKEGEKITYKNDSLGDMIITITNNYKTTSYEEKLKWFGPNECTRYVKQEVSNQSNTVRLVNYIQISDRNEENNIGYDYIVASSFEGKENRFVNIYEGKYEIDDYLKDRLEPVTIKKRTYTQSMMIRNDPERILGADDKNENDALDSLCIQKGKGMIALWTGEKVWVREDLVE
jgi:hypothetical protein